MGRSIHSIQVGNEGCELIVQNKKINNFFNHFCIYILRKPHLQRIIAQQPLKLFVVKGFSLSVVLRCIETVQYKTFKNLMQYGLQRILQILIHQKKFCCN